jgi:histidine triad (HIT) family protein
MATPKCIFCSIAKHDIPSDIVFENDNFLAIKDIHPEAPTHVLVIPKEHYEKLTDVPEGKRSLYEGLFSAAVDVAKKLGIESACRFSVNNGQGAGQIVPHIHVHLLSHEKQM